MQSSSILTNVIKGSAYHIRALNIFPRGSNLCSNARHLTSLAGGKTPSQLTQVTQRQPHCPELRASELSFSSSSASGETSKGGKIWQSPYPDVSVPEISLPEYVMKKFCEFGDRTALVDGPTGRTYTFSQLQDQIIKVASCLTRKGFKKGDVATIFSPNCPEFAVFYLAWISIGGVTSAVNPLYTSNELQHALNNSESKLLVSVPQLLPIVNATRSSSPGVKEVILFGEGEGGCQSFSSMLNDDGKAFPDNINIDVYEDLAALPYSSGTTGLPKGVMLTHYSLVANIEQLRYKSCLPYSIDDTLIGVLPMFHIYGQIPVLLASLAQGSQLVTLPNFTPETYLSAIQDYKANILQVAPPIVLFLAKHPIVDKYDYSSVTQLVSGAAPLGGEVLAEAKKRMPNASFVQGYGLTEASPVTHLTPWDSDKYNSIGVSLPNTEYMIRDLQSGDPLAPGEEGELLIRGPQVMKGYFKQPESTANTIMNGWLHTGDIGYTDEEGYVVISDRLKELIKYKGFQVAPAELENLLLTHPSIQDTAVIGMPDERAGELPRGYIVVKPNATITEDEIHAFLDGKVAVYKQLSGGIEFRSEIPKSASGKILRRVLKDELKAKM